MISNCLPSTTCLAGRACLRSAASRQPASQCAGRVPQQQCRAGPIELIVTDVDGTLLNSQQELTPRVQAAVKASEAAGVPVVVATGKARGPWADEVLPAMGPPRAGVFMQGLVIYNEAGEVIYSNPLDNEVAGECIDFAEAHGLTLTAYCGERILCAETDEHTDRLIWYKEPTPEAVGTLRNYLGKIDIHKLIFMAPQERIDEIRPLADAQFGGRVALTTALTGMLEVLPPGASKGSGVTMLLDRLGIGAASIMAMGDGENDVEMLQMAGTSVAMGNAGPKALAAADHVVGTNDQDGAAQAIEQFVLEPLSVAVESGS